MHTGLIVLLVFISLCVVAYCCWWHRRWREETRTTPADLPARTVEWTDNISEADVGETIFVGITCYRDSQSLIETLYSLFSTAACAKRVHVGVLLHDAGNADDKVFRQYRALCHARGSPEMACNIHIRCLPTEYAIGPVEARRQLLSSDIALFHGQAKYVLLVHSHTAFAPNWDATLLRSLPYDDGDHHRRVVVTTVLPATDAIFGCFSRNETSTTAQPTFPCLVPSTSDAPSHLPVIRSRTCSGPLSARGLPVIAACSQLLFGRADVVVPIFAGADAYGFFPFFNKDIQDFYLTLQLWSAGCDLIGPICHVASHINVVPISYDIGQRHRSDHGSSRTRQYALMILSTAILLTLAKEQTVGSNFLEAPYFNVAACGAIPRITAQTEQFIESEVKKANLPSSVMARFQKATISAQSGLPSMRGDVYERMLAQLSAITGDGGSGVRSDKDDEEKEEDKDNMHDDLLSAYMLAKTVKLNPLVINAFHNPQKTLTSYFDYSGYDWITKAFSGRCIMGLCDDATEADIITRYNSRSAYYKERQKWCPV